MPETNWCCKNGALRLKKKKKQCITVCVGWDEAEESPSGCTSSGCTAWPESSEATSSLRSSLGARANTRSKQWREETKWLWLGGVRYKRLFTSRAPLRSSQVLNFFHLPLVAPSTSSSQLICYIIGISLPCAFSFSCMWFSKYPRFLLSVLRRLNHSCANFYRTNITWHTHNCVKKRKEKTTGCHKLYTFVLNNIIKEMAS